MPFAKGQTGNRNGRPRLTDEQRQAREMIRKGTVAAIATLIRALSSEDEDNRIKAASILVAKGLPSGVQLDINHVSGLTDDELLAEIDRRTNESSELAGAAEAN
jgi:hypothetical protein